MSIERFVKVSWKTNTKTGAAENVEIETHADAMEETTAACIMLRNAFETVAQTNGKEKARKCLLQTARFALMADEEIEAYAKERGIVTQQ